MSLAVSFVEQIAHNRFNVAVVYTPSDGLSQLDGKDYFFDVAALDISDAKQKAIALMGIKLKGNIKVNKVTNKQILDKALLVRAEYDKYIEDCKKGIREWSGVRMTRGILWGKNKETGNLYHAYCEFCGELFEDATQYKKDCEQYARKYGWVIGNTKETKDIAVCPKCREKMKLKIANVC